MTEPSGRARRVFSVVPGLFRWSVRDDRIGGAESDAYALLAERQVILIDPLPIVASALEDLGDVEAIVLTAACHQRSSWRFRKRFGAPVYAPAGVAIGREPGELEESPDQRYRGGDTLPGSLLAIHAPGPAEAMYALWHGPTKAVFVSDLLFHDGTGTPDFVPARYQDDPKRTRVSVRKLLERLPAEVLCFEHGPPIIRHVQAALQRALDEDTELAGEPGAPV